MDLNTKIPLANSSVTLPSNAISITPMDNTIEMHATIMLRRPLWNNQSMIDYADGIINGTIKDTLSYADFAQHFSAKQADIDDVVNFVKQSNLTVIEASLAAATVKVSGSVANFNAAFNITLDIVQMTNYKFVGYNGILMIPASLDGVIEYVLGLHNPIKLKHLAIPAASISAAETALTPIQVAAAYNFPTNDGYGACVGIIEYGGGYTTQNLTSTFSQLGYANPTIVDVLVDGGTNNPGDSNGAPEVMLDIYCCGGVVPKAKLAIYFGYGGGDSSPVPGSNWYDPINTAIHDTTNSPSVLSISWGAGELSYWTPTTISATDAILAQAVTMGVTVCVSSGDNGSTWGGTEEEVLYPASSRYVLGVGGTTLQLSGNSRSSEVAWSDSGGGISAYQAIQSWQSGLTTKAYPSGTVSSLTVRGVPDISANADPNTGYQFYWGTGNTYSQYGGTSAAAPLIAGMIARINQLTGKRIGYANTLFYANPSAFYDITSGENAAVISTGYSATSGWDAVTGLGVPNGSNIFRLVNTGAVYPNTNFGFRPSTGAVWPRITTGARPD
jgi:kumamolisin